MKLQLIPVELKISPTKINLLKMCKERKHWYELVKQMQVSETQLFLHTRWLVSIGLLDKNMNGYMATEQGNRIVSISAPLDKIYTKINNIVEIGRQKNGTDAQ